MSSSCCSRLFHSMIDACKTPLTGRRRTQRFQSQLLLLWSPLAFFLKIIRSQDRRPPREVIHPKSNPKRKPFNVIWSMSRLPRNAIQTFSGFSTTAASFEWNSVYYRGCANRLNRSSLSSDADGWRCSGGGTAGWDIGALGRGGISILVSISLLPPCTWLNRSVSDAASPAEVSAWWGCSLGLPP